MNNVLYFRVAKTASSSILNGWSARIDKTKVKLENTIIIKHLNYPENLEIIERNKDSFWFSSIRHPYYRAISSYKYGLLHRGWFNKNLKFEEFLEIPFPVNYGKNKYHDDHMSTHCCSMSFYLKDYIKDIKFFVRVENLQEDLDKLSDLLDINRVVLDKKWYETKYDKSEIPLLLTQEIKDKIYKKYEEDFDNFKYLK